VKRAEQTSFFFAAGETPHAVPRVARDRTFRPAPKPAPTAIDDTELARQRLERRIGAHLPGRRLALAVTDNRYTMISVRREKGIFRLRLHHMFLEAEPEVVRALGRYVGDNDRDSSSLLGRFIDVHQEHIRRARRVRSAAVTIETRGEVHDLAEIYDDLNRRLFSARIDAKITWGLRTPPGGKRKRRNSIKMGSYSVEDRLIRIHPSLDRDFVPRYFVEWIVYHEMLHQKHHIPVVGGRRQFHTRAFLAEEATFTHYERARRWERENLNRLLVY
jgi:predicted metal-dependent hydrolase